VRENVTRHSRVLYEKFCLEAYISADCHNLSDQQRIIIDPAIDQKKTRGNAIERGENDFFCKRDYWAVALLAKILNLQY